MRTTAPSGSAPARVGAALLAACLAAPLPGCGVFSAERPSLPAPLAAVAAEPTSASVGPATAAPGDWAAYDLYQDRALEAYVNAVARRLAVHAALDGPPLRVILVDAPIANATAGTTNEIVLTVGLVALLADEAELAWVLAHEIGHLERGHPALIADMMRAPDIEGVERRAALRRRFEVEADARAVELMTAAGYDVSAARRVTLMIGGAGGLLASHPNAEERLEALPRDGDGRRGADAYLDAIEGLPFTFPGRLTALLRDGVIVAPSLDIVIEPPAGYALRDKGDSLEFESQDGLIRIRFRPEPPSALSLEAVLTERLHGAIVRTSGAGPLTDIGPLAVADGLAGVSGRAQTSFGGVAGEAYLAVIEDERRRYAVAAYYPSDRREEVAAAMAAFAASIRPIGPDDRVLLDGFVVRTEIIRPGEDYAALRQRIDGPQLREGFFLSFNGLSADAPLPAGRRVKIVAYR